MIIKSLYFKTVNANSLFSDIYNFLSNRLLFCCVLICDLINKILSTCCLFYNLLHIFYFFYIAVDMFVYFQTLLTNFLFFRILFLFQTLVENSVLWYYANSFSPSTLSFFSPHVFFH